MQTAKAVGRHAASRKYDLMTALGVHALAAQGHLQVLVLRFITLLTARYNWQNDELSMGRAEMARLWSVDERTVKRELARLRTMGWMTVKRPGARGRVAVYSVDMGQILMDTRDVWSVIGPDFVARMEEETPAPPDPKVVPFPARAVDAPVGQGGWADVQRVLHDRHPELWAAWFHQLDEIDIAGGEAVLTAPSRFAADYVTTHLTGKLLAAYGRFDPSIRRVRIDVV